MSSPHRMVHPLARQKPSKSTGGGNARTTNNSKHTVSIHGGNSQHKPSPSSNMQKTQPPGEAIARGRQGSVRARAPSHAPKDTVQNLFRRHCDCRGLGTAWDVFQKCREKATSTTTATTTSSTTTSTSQPQQSSVPSSRSSVVRRVDAFAAQQAAVCGVAVQSTSLCWHTPPATRTSTPAVCSTESEKEPNDATDAFCQLFALWAAGSYRQVCADSAAWMKNHAAHTDQTHRRIVASVRAHSLVQTGKHAQVTDELKCDVTSEVKRWVSKRGDTRSQTPTQTRTRTQADSIVQYCYQDSTVLEYPFFAYVIHAITPTPLTASAVLLRVEELRTATRLVAERLSLSQGASESKKAEQQVADSCCAHPESCLWRSRYMYLCVLSAAYHYKTFPASVAGMFHVLEDASGWLERRAHNPCDRYRLHTLLWVTARMLLEVGRVRGALQLYETMYRRELTAPDSMQGALRLAEQLSDSHFFRAALVYQYLDLTACILLATRNMTGARNTWMLQLRHMISREESASGSSSQSQKDGKQTSQRSAKPPAVSISAPRWACQSVFLNLSLLSMLTLRDGQARHLLEGLVVSDPVGYCSADVINALSVAYSIESSSPAHEHREVLDALTQRFSCDGVMVATPEK